jgi:DNA-binding transcriptional LysR family regulator
MTRHAVPDLNNTRFLVEVVQAGSFSAAARAFQLPPSTVSRRIARLEEQLGARLFQRTTRSLQLTEAGRSYLEHARRALAELTAGQQAIGVLQETPRGRVRLAAPTGFGDLLGDLLSRFLVEFSDVRVDVELGARYVDIIEEDFDLALRASRDSSSTLVGRRLNGSPRQLFASPSYLERRGTPRSVTDLEHHDCVIAGARSDRVTWTLYVGTAMRRVTVRGRVAVNDPPLAARYASKGLGIAFLPRALCVPFIRSGELRQILPRVSGGESSLWLVYPDRRLPAAARALADFLTKELSRILPRV